MKTNVQIFESLLQDFNEKGIAGALPYFDEAVEVFDPDLPDGHYRGQAALHYLLGQMLSGAEQTQVLGYDLLPAGDRVVALLWTYSRGEGGVPEVEVRDAHTMTFRDGKITYWRLYTDRVEALTDAGLDPEIAQQPKT